MNVFQIEGYGNYGGGLAIIAASNKVQARALASTIKDTQWDTNYIDGELSQLDDVVAHGYARVITHFETGE